MFYSHCLPHHSVVQIDNLMKLLILGVLVDGALKLESYLSVCCYTRHVSIHVDETLISTGDRKEVTMKKVDRGAKEIMSRASGLNGIF